MDHSVRVPSPEVEIQEKLSELVDRCKEVAFMVGEGREVFAECSYCHGSVPLWEALFTQQISGVLAHLSCPQDMLAQVVGEAAPQEGFDYPEFIRAVDARMELAHADFEAGTIEIPGADPEIIEHPAPADTPAPSSSSEQA